MSEWWQARSARERMLLRVMLGLAVIVLGWLLVVRPLGDSLEAAKARHGAAVVALAEAKARRETIRGVPGAAPTLPVDSLIGQSAGEAGFTAARVTAAGPARASVTIESARPQALFGWVASLERRGLVVERLQVRANADRTLAAELAFRARGS